MANNLSTFSTSFIELDYLPSAVSSITWIFAFFCVFNIASCNFCGKTKTNNYNSDHLGPKTFNSQNPRQNSITFTWIAFSVELSGISHGNAKDDDFGFVDTQPGLVDGHGLIFLKNNYLLACLCKKRNIKTGYLYNHLWAYGRREPSKIQKMYIPGNKIAKIG